MRLWIFIVLLASCYAAVKNIDINNLPNPGKMVYWSPSSQNIEEKHLTASHSVDKALEKFLSRANEHEVVVVLKSTEHKDRSLLAHNFIHESIRNAPSKTIISHVYVTEPNMKSISASISAESEAVKSVDALVKHLENHEDVLNNEETEIYEVNIDNVKDASLKKLENIAKKNKMMLVAYEEAHSDSVAPRRLGSYKLTTTDTTINTNDASSIYYKPEGAEYAIYYADTYLYITPDIFTGLMTGLFFFFTLFTGISCLGSIQGMSSFYDKLPVVGREA
jgi:hypothetical protein